MATTPLPEGPLQHRPVLSHPRGSLQQVNAKSKANSTDLSPTRMSHNDQSTYTTESEVLDSGLNTPGLSSTLSQAPGDVDTSIDPSLNDITEAEGSEDEFEQQDMVIYKKRSQSPLKLQMSSMPSFSRPGSPHSSTQDRNPSPVRSLIGHSTMMSPKDGVPESQEADSMRRVLDQLDERNKQLRERSAQLNEKNRQLSGCFAQLDEKNKQLAASYAQLQERTDLARKLGKELEEAHDFIFTLQPKRQVISPENAAAAFKTLCGSVEEWVQTNLRDILDNQVKLNAKDFTLEDVAAFMDLVSTEGRKHAANISETDEYNIIAVTMTFLYRKIFVEKFWFPMHNGASDFLERLEADMYQLEPRRDLATVRTWRSETYRAYTGRSSFASMRQRHIKLLTNDLEKALKVFLPKFDEKARHSLQATVIDPATTLAQELQLSIDKFDVMPTGLTPTSSRGDLSMYECQNLLPPKRILKFPSANTRNNRYIMDIYPGLYYQAVKGNSYDAVQVLTKPKILVASTKPEEGVYKPPHVQSGKCVTWVGWLEDISSGKKQNNRWLGF